ncbi:Hypothetical Protein FCC1311_052252 [Hondaea fermentalgiana]|uniref:Metallo-beta-lactamase domain-containing protein n=1 Tax=Hondaea fermentalgiana TaxID=2315210 RepID=A0A2R5GK45_9STRA|nr:Hypothetical Protein FCC1311_052252 [Hondaea fermentalgiana]|eukprot:GBG29003.1 Hypothetical Protein FCC1311_052252 [Hondaea fermentalgiana]
MAASHTTRLARCLGAGAALGLAAVAGFRGDENAARAQMQMREDKRAGETGAPPCVVFMGTGTSSVNPHLNCVLGLQPSFNEVGGCETCQKALRDGPPEVNKNVRGNPSMLICFDAHSTSTKTDDEPQHDRVGAQRHFVQIDCGKTFRETALTWYPRHGIPRLDAVVITHDHADAVFGLDDLRLVAKPGNPVEVYTSLHTYNMIKRAFPYLVRDPAPDFIGPLAHLADQDPSKVDAMQDEVKTFIATLKYKVMSTPSLDDALSPFSVAGLDITPLPVYHGANYLSLGFAFGKSNRKFVYLSDVSEIPPKIMDQLRKWDIEYLVIDTLHKKRKYPTHLSLEQSLEIIEELRPAKSFLIGVSHNFEHDRDNAMLANLKETKGIDVQIPHDGLKIELHNIEL